MLTAIHLQGIRNTLFNIIWSKNPLYPTYGEYFCKVKQERMYGISYVDLHFINNIFHIN